MVNKFQSKPAVFFDRDGVITIPIRVRGKGFAPRNLEDFKFYDDSIKSLERIKSAGFISIVVSNQPDVATGLLPIKVLEEMNAILLSSLAVNDVINCQHTSENECLCRKPKPGMIFTAVEKHGIDLSRSWIVGDRDSDIEAGISAGLRSVFINRDWINEAGSKATFECKSLNDAVNFILMHKS